MYIIKTEKGRFSMLVNLFGQFYSSVLVPAIDICHGAALFSEKPYSIHDSPYLPNSTEIVQKVNTRELSATVVISPLYMHSERSITF